MRNITAPIIHTLCQGILKNHAISIDDTGKIIAIRPSSDFKEEALERYDGVLVPGFINTHCHLELSHMKGMIETGTGLITFIKNVVQRRNAPQEKIQEAIERAEAEMIENGIVAVGDISNVTDTFAQKSKNNLIYHTFIEHFDFREEEKAQETLAQYASVYEALALPHLHQKTNVPHAPYSVSNNLFAALKEINQNRHTTISIHNQETQAEEEMFLKGRGELYGFYEAFGIPTEHLLPTRKSALQSILPLLDSTQKTLFVHNTLTQEEDIVAAHAFSDQVYWATCPNANLYIENRLPDYSIFMKNNAKMTIGTDSLASNWQLSVLEEMKTIYKYQSYVKLENLLDWACINGAKALGLEKHLGSIALGKSPGINLITNLNSGELSPSSAVKKIA